MVRVLIEIESKFDAEGLTDLIKKSAQEVELQNLVEDVKETMPSTMLVLGLLRGLPKGKVTTTIKSGA